MGKGAPEAPLPKAQDCPTLAVRLEVKVLIVVTAGRGDLMEADFRFPGVSGMFILLRADHSERIVSE